MTSISTPVPKLDSALQAEANYSKAAASKTPSSKDDEIAALEKHIANLKTDIFKLKETQAKNAKPIPPSQTVVIHPKPAGGSVDPDQIVEPIKIDPAKNAKLPPPSQTDIPSAPRSESPLLGKGDLIERGFMPELFCHKLATSNGKKHVDDPIAFICLPEEADQAETFTSLAAQIFYLEIAKTHIVILQYLKDGNIQSQIQKFQFILKLPNNSGFEDLLLLVGHGNSKRILFGKGSSRSDYYYEPKAADFDGLRKNTALMAIVCKSGRRLAPAISTVYPGKVMAPIKIMYFLGNSIQHCKKHGLELVSFNTKQKQHVQIFVKGDSCEPCQDPKALEKTISRLTFQAQWDPQAQTLLGIAYRFGFGVPKSIFKWLKYTIKAAKTDRKGQFNLGAFYHAQGSSEKAFEWLNRAAKQNLCEAVDFLENHYS